MKKFKYPFIAFINLILVVLFSVAIGINVSIREHNKFINMDTEYETTYKTSADNISNLSKVISRHSNSSDSYYLGSGELVLEGNNIYSLNFDYVYTTNFGMVFGLCGYYDNKYLSIMEEGCSRNPRFNVKLDSILDLIECTSNSLLKAYTNVSFSGATIFDASKDELVFENGNLYQPTSDVHGRFYRVVYYSDINIDKLIINVAI